MVDRSDLLFWSSVSSVLGLILTLPSTVHIGQSPGNLKLLASIGHSTKLKRECERVKGSLHFQEANTASWKSLVRLQLHWMRSLGQRASLETTVGRGWWLSIFIETCYWCAYFATVCCLQSSFCPCNSCMSVRVHVYMDGVLVSPSFFLSFCFPTSECSCHSVTWGCEWITSSLNALEADHQY